MIASLTTTLLLSPALAFQDQNRITPIVEVIRRTRPAVVSIQTNPASGAPRTLEMLFRGGRGGGASGSGAVLFEDGYIVTNFHVVSGVAQDQGRIVVRFDPADDPEPYEARLISFVEEEDLALIKIDGAKPFPTIPLCASDPILGETVIAIGNPFGQSHTVSTGIISGLHRDIQASGRVFQNLIQTDASINPGNSGGPLLNVNGEIIGLNTAMNVAAENIGFAIPVDRIRRVLKDELLSISKARTWLGYALEPEGVVVREVWPDGPAAAAGLQSGDRLLSFNGKEVEDRQGYQLARLAVEPGADVSVAIERGRKRLELQVKAWNFVDGFLFERTGMTVEPIFLGRGAWGEQLIHVTRVQKQGPAEVLGLRVGDVIRAVRPQGWRPSKLKNGEDFAFLILRLEPGIELEVEIWRDEDGDGYYERDAEYSEVFTGVLPLR